MDWKLFVDVLLKVLFFILLLAITYTIINTIKIKKEGKESVITLQNRLNSEKLIFNPKIEKAKIINNLNSQLLKTNFKIIKELLSLQKLIFESKSQ